MATPVNVAIAGATGAVGVEMLLTLEKRNFPVKNLKLLASARSVGKTFKFHGETVAVEEMTEDSFKGVDIALFSAGASISKQFRAAVTAAGAVMIDNSSAFRMEDDVPLVVPEVNPEDIAKHHGVIANPNCTTAIMLVAVAPLHRAKTLRRLVASTYQAASGAGAKGMDGDPVAGLMGDGGDGLPCSITGEEVWYAGGGGACSGADSFGLRIRLGLSVGASVSMEGGFVASAVSISSTPMRFRRSERIFETPFSGIVTP